MGEFFIWGKFTQETENHQMSQNTNADNNQEVCCAQESTNGSDKVDNKFTNGPEKIKNLRMKRR